MLTGMPHLTGMEYDDENVAEKKKTSNWRHDSKDDIYKRKFDSRRGETT